MVGGKKRASDYKSKPTTKHPDFKAPSHGYITMMPPEMLPDTGATND